MSVVVAVQSILKSKIVRGDINAFKAAASGFEIKYVRSYAGDTFVLNELLVLVLSGA